MYLEVDFLVKSKPHNAILDSGVLVIIVLVLSLSAVIGYSVFSDINSDIQTDADISNTTKTISGNLHTIYPNLLDNLFLMAFVLFVVFMIVSVFLLDTHPVFFVITIVLLGTMFLVAMLLSNTYTEIMEDSDFSDEANQFPYITWVNDHLVELIIAIGFMTGILLFMKFKS